MKLHDSVVFAIGRGQGALSAKDRAKAASEALDEVVSTDVERIRVNRDGDVAVLYADSVAIAELHREDADLAGVSLDVYARSIASRIENALRAERKRTRIAGTVFSVSLVILFGLIALYIIRKVGEFSSKTRQWTVDNPDRIPAIRLQSLEVIGPAALRGGILATLLVGRIIAQVGIAYAWLVFTLSLFAATRPLTARLTGFVLTPLSDLAGRVAASLPLALVAIVSGVAVYVLVRFTQLFFASVARGETQLEWLPPELALPTSVLLRAGIVVAALVFAAPIVTGDPEGVLARSGSIVLLAIGLASTPVLASAVAGVVVVYGRKLHVGHHAEVGGRIGRVLEVGLLEVHLLDEDGCDVRVPHLLSLFHPTRSLGRFRRMTVDVRVDASARPAEVRRLLLDVAARFGENVTVDLMELDATVACYRVRAALGSEARAGDLRAELVEALRGAEIPLAPGVREVGVA